ncbi:hypothetical protein [Saccharothrix violaceirubra]|uniref:Type III secretion system (T3SS) SseB-like protein n=1 Tax=Saccharothrix violaceirubra TaxID=413306 RepID=A0A7W7WXR0_9PSEU|nr:hypothetical protein [Saccharothrix violaceirubra]MBB4967397.1 hypothetical protein [Saccharothrix violaceirubra]
MRERPVVTDDLRARATSNTWLQVFDPVLEKVLGPVGEAVVGRYLVDADGRITDTYVENPRLLRPENELEAALLLAGAGQVGQDDVVVALLGAELVLPLDPSRRERPHLVFRDEGPVRVVDAFTSAKVLPADWPPHWQRRTGVELAVLFDRAGEDFVLRLCGPVGLRVDLPEAGLVRALRDVVGSGVVVAGEQSA